MKRIPSMVDLAVEKDPETALSTIPSTTYPMGLQICLCQDVLDKLNVDHSDWKVGDTFHLHALAKITSKSSHEMQGGEQNNVSMQLIAMTGEDEEPQENEKEEDGE